MSYYSVIELEASYLLGVKSFITLNYNYLLNNYYVLDTILIIGDVKRKRFLAFRKSVCILDLL